MEDEEAKAVAAPFGELADQMPGAKVAPATGIAAIALSMALKYHDINTVQDGTLYQQYKIEGRNMQPFHLDHVFETAIKMEMHLLGASDRIAKIVIDAVIAGVEEGEASDEGLGDRTSASGPETSA